MYAHMRNMYGQSYFYNSLITGTDEATWGKDADGNFKDMDCSGVGSILSTSYPSSVLWGEAFPNINTASGVIENASAAGISNALLLRQGSSVLLIIFFWYKPSVVFHWI